MKLENIRPMKEVRTDGHIPYDSFYMKYQKIGESIKMKLTRDY
jgi:hypothetical protein